MRCGYLSVKDTISVNFYQDIVVLFQENREIFHELFASSISAGQREPHVRKGKKIVQEVQDITGNIKLLSIIIIYL